MYFWNSYPFVRLSIVFILGVLCFDQYPILWAQPILCLSAGTALLLVLVYCSAKFGFYKFRHINGVFALLIISFLGGYFTKIKYHSQEQSHYKNLTVRTEGFSGIVITPVNERANHLRYDLKLLQVVANDSIMPASGVIHLYIRKDSLSNPFVYGDHIHVCGGFFSISAPGNPSEFNYKQYLARQNIYAHSFVKAEEVKLDRNMLPNTFLKWAYSIRKKAAKIIDSNIPQPRENGIAKALLLGIKDHLDNDLKKAYSAAGAMHVLAVSGLHVGIIFMIVRLIFGKLKETGRPGKASFGIISVCIIWVYASVTGLSPSVLRAATMFSLIAIGEVSSKTGNIYNSLGLAAFILLLFDPYLIYSVGFQLSFAAVLGIVYLQPKLYQLVHSRFWLIDKAWAITCVSLAAQVSTFPLTAYYFHQFPTYFLASNLLVIPASFLMLTGGVCLLIVSPIYAAAGHYVGLLLQQFIWLVNETIGAIQLLPYSLIEWIHIDSTELILAYSILLTLLAGLHYSAFKTTAIAGFLTIAFLLRSMMSNETQSYRNELIFYEIPDKIAVDHIVGHQASLFIDEFSEVDIELLSYQINPNRLASHLPPISKKIITFDEALFDMKDVIGQGYLADKRIILFDSTTFHLEFKQPIATDYLIINNGSVKSLKWLKEKFSFEQVIISTKNSIYYSRKMKKQAVEHGIKIHSLLEDGALRIAL